MNFDAYDRNVRLNREPISCSDSATVISMFMSAPGLRIEHRQAGLQAHTSKTLIQSLAVPQHLNPKIPKP